MNVKFLVYSEYSINVGCCYQCDELGKGDYRIEFGGFRKYFLVQGLFQGEVVSFSEERGVEEVGSFFFICSVFLVERERQRGFRVEVVLGIDFVFGWICVGGWVECSIYIGWILFFFQQIVEKALFQFCLFLFDFDLLFDSVREVEQSSVEGRNFYFVVEKIEGLFERF